MADIDWSKGEITPPDGNSGTDWDAGEITPPPKPSGAIRRIADLGISAAKSAIAVPEVALGIADIASGGRAGQLAEGAGFRPKEAKAMLDEFYSPEQKAANAAVQDAQGFLPTIGAAVKNPSTIANTVVESAFPMLAGGLAARGIAATTKIAPWLAGAAGEGVVGAGSAAEQTRQQSDDGLLSGKQTAASVASGLATAGLGAAGGKVAQKLWISDIDTVLAGGAAQGASKGLLRRVGEGAVAEGVLEELPQSMAEQALQNVAQDKPLGQGVAESGAMGMLAGAVMGGGAAGVLRGKPAATESDVPQTDVDSPVSPPVGPLSAAAATVQGTGGEVKAFPFTDAKVAQKRADAQTASTGTPYEVVDHPSAPGRFAVLPAAAKEEKGTAKNTDIPRADDAPMTAAAAELPAPIDTANVNPETGEIKSAFAQREADRPMALDGDILNLDGQPFPNMWVAKKAANEAGEGFQIIKLAKNEFVVRPKEQADGTSPDISALPATNAGSGRVDAGTGVAAGVRPGAADAGAVVAGRAGNQPNGDAVSPADRADAGAVATEGLSSKEAQAVAGSVLEQVSTREGTASSTNEIVPEQARLPEQAGHQKTVEVGQSLGSAYQKSSIHNTLENPNSQATENPSQAQASSAQAPATAGTAAVEPPATGIQAGAGALEADGVKPAENAQTAPVDAQIQAADAEKAGFDAQNAAAHAAATSPLNDLPEPTPAQKEAGNYRKGHLNYEGLDLSIENPVGSSRSGVDPDGKAWKVDMTAHYGYVKRTTGADAEQVDVYLADKPAPAAPVFVVDQYAPDGKFDEVKAVLGVNSQAEAETLYDAHFSDGSGPARRQGVTQMTVEGFKEWARSDAAKLPAAPAQPATATANKNEILVNIRDTLRTKAADTENNGDVGLQVGSKVKFIPFDDAVKAAQRAVAAGVRAVPFQIHNEINIRLGDTDRVIAAMAAAEPQFSRAAPEPASAAQPTTASPKAPVKPGLQKMQAAKAAREAAAVAKTVAPAEPKAANVLGRNNVPLAEGGKAFKTRQAADDARKLNTMMRVIRAPGGYALKEKTAAQLAAQEKAARRLRNPQTSPPGQPIPAHAMIAAAGGLRPDTRADMGMEGNVRIGNRSLFADVGKGLTMERATEKLIEDGYLPEGAGHDQARTLIKRSLTQPQYTPDGFERLAEAEAATNFEDYLAAQQDAAQNAEFDPFETVAEFGFTLDDAENAGYNAADDAIKLEVNALLQQAEAIGLDTDEIKGQAHEQTIDGSEQDYFEAARTGLQKAIEAGAGDSVQNAGQQSNPGSEEGLTSPTREDVLAQQQRKEDGAKAEAKAKAAAENKAKADAERNEFTLTGSDRAADVGAAGGQDNMFARAERKVGIADAPFLARKGFDADAFSRMFRPPTAMSVTDVQKAVDQLTSRWKSGPAIKVVATPAELPIRAPRDARGLIHNGTAYVVAGNHLNRDGIARTLGHEAIGHYSLWRMLGEDGRRGFERNLQAALKFGNKPLGKIRDKVRAAYVDDTGKFNLSAAEEANEIAAFAVEAAIDPATGEFNPGFGFMKQVWAKVAEFLRSLGITVKFTNAELQGMLMSSMRGLEAGHKLDGGGQTLVAAARSAPPTVFNAKIAFANTKYDKGQATAEQAARDAAEVMGFEAGVPVLAENRADMPLTPMRYDLQQGVILYNTAVKRGRAADVEYMIEEVLHALDHVGGQNTISASNPRFLPGGDIRQELESAYTKSAAMADVLAHPLAEEYTDSVIAAELFARTGAKFYSNPTLLRVTAPKTYELFKSAFGLPSVGRAVPGQVRRPAPGRTAQVGQPDDGDGRSLPGTAGGNPAQPGDGLQRLRESVLREFGGQAGGAGVDFGDSGSSLNAGNPNIAFARGTIGDTLKSITVTDLKAKTGNKLADYRGLGLQLLGGRQLNDLYGKDIPQLDGYTHMVQQMAADANEVGANADNIATSWGKLADEKQLAELMHDATLAQIDPAKDFVPGDNRLQWGSLNAKFKALSAEAKKVYTDARDGYEEHYAQVREAIRDKIERSDMAKPAKAALLERMDGEFFDKIKGVYFPLARFGKYVVVTRNKAGEVVNVSRAETLNEAEATRQLMRQAYPPLQGFAVGKVLKDKEFNAARDAVGRGFLKELFGVLDEKGMGEELQDAVNQLYLASMPDLSWAKHGIHRKGTPGFSQDARRAFAQNMFHGARYLAKLRYADQLQDKLTDMQNYVESKAGDEAYDSVKGQQVVDELVKRHDSLMNPKSNPLSTALTSFGFVFHLGLSPASAMVNLSQTALVAYPIMGAKWGFDKAAAALTMAGKQAATHKNDISKALNGDERRAYDAAVKAGTIDVTNAHDLAGIAQGEDAKVSWKLRPVMKWASFMFHHAERFNRQVTFVASYRLARGAGANHDAAYEQATKATYDGHFDYAASNRPRIMQGNAAKVLLLFKQYGQNMVYTMARQAQQAIKAETPQGRAEARKALGGLLVLHASAAGVLGLPMVSTLLAAASMLGGSDDEPWDAEVALRNMLADTFGQKPAEVMARGFSRLTPIDISGRVGLDKLIIPDIQEGLEGQRLGEAVMTAALGPVAGIGISALKGMQDVADGKWASGLETMMPAALRGPMKALRYGTEGVKDRTGIVVKDDVGAAGLAGQAVGFSPSEVRNAFEGRSAVYAADKRLMERRQDLMSQYAKAVMDKDPEGVSEARKDIQGFNEKNPSRQIRGLQLQQSLRMRAKRIANAENGVYLPRNRRDVAQEGRFAAE